MGSRGPLGGPEGTCLRPENLTGGTSEALADMLGYISPDHMLKLNGEPRRYLDGPFTKGYGSGAVQHEQVARALLGGPRTMDRACST